MFVCAPVTCDVDFVDVGLSFVSNNSTTTSPINLKSLSVYIFFALRPSCDKKNFIDDNNDDFSSPLVGIREGASICSTNNYESIYLIPSIIVPTPYVMP